MVKYNTACDTARIARLLGWRARHDGLHSALEAVARLLAPGA
jgi:hypothetical protein